MQDAGYKEYGAQLVHKGKIYLTVNTASMTNAVNSDQYIIPLCAQMHG